MKIEIGKQKSQVSLRIRNPHADQEMELGEIEMDLRFEAGAITFDDKKFFGDLADVLRDAVKDLDKMAAGEGGAA